MRRVFTILALVFSLPGFSQVSEPFRDCQGALTICNSVFTFHDYGNGYGEIDEINPATTCLSSGETKSLWVRVTVTAPGQLGFRIIPTQPQTDIDWALYDLTNANCSEIYDNPVLEVSCNFSGSTFPTAETGMNNGPNNQDEQMINVTSGQEFYLVINNFSGVMLDYDVDFTISTCLFNGCSNVSGYVYADENQDCDRGNGELTLANRIVKLQPVESSDMVYTGYTNASGLYSISFPDQGEYVPGIINSGLVNQACAPETLMIDTSQQFSYFADIPVAISEWCSQLVVRNEIPRLRKCFQTTRVIEICNEGSLVSAPASLALTYDAEVIPVSATIPLVNTADSVYTLAIDPIPPFSCITIYVNDSASCDAPAWSYACVSALIDPASQCSTLTEPFVTLFDSCSADQYFLTLKNDGGSMSSPVNVFITAYSENDSYYHQHNVLLGANEQATWHYPNDGHTFSSGIVYQNGNAEFLPYQDCDQSDAAYSQSVIDYSASAYSSSCELIVASFDPNDKTGYPSGLGDEHLILRDQELKYRIRFQNTGNDTAFTVVIRDTLPTELDFNTLLPGLSSHDFVFQMDGNIAIFTFNNILLPDSTTNEAGSMGFVDYSIKQQVSNPQEYVIENSAAIYFDFNDPVITEPYIYTVRIIPLSIKENDVKTPSVLPNPSNSGFYLNLPEKGKNVTLEIMDYSGRMVTAKVNASGGQYISTAHLSNGFYLVRVKDNEELMGVIKLVVLH